MRARSVVALAVPLGLLGDLDRTHAALAGLDVAAKTSRAAVEAKLLLLAVVLLAIPVGYSLDYAIKGAGEFTLTGIILAVGMFGGYAAIVAVFLAIAGFSPVALRAKDESDAGQAEHDGARRARGILRGDRTRGSAGHGRCRSHR